LVENNHIFGDAAIEAYGWAEERREELELRKQEARVTRVQGQEKHLIMILLELRQFNYLLKIALAVMCVLVAMVAVLLVKQ
jgi:hypothetical protein